MCKRYTGSRALCVICMLWHLLLAKKFPLYAIQFPRILPETSAYLDNLYCKNKTFFFWISTAKTKLATRVFVFYQHCESLCSLQQSSMQTHWRVMFNLTLFYLRVGEFFLPFGGKMQRHPWLYSLCNNPLPCFSQLMENLSGKKLVRESLNFVSGSFEMVLLKSLISCWNK